MEKDILNFCIEKGILLDKQVLEVIGNVDDIEIIKNLIDRIKFKYNQKIITKAFFLNNLERVQDILSNYSKEHRKIIEGFFIELGVEVGYVEKFESEIGQLGERKKQMLEESENVRLLKIYENKPKKLEVKDFVKNFRNRFNTIKNILQERSILDNLVSINHLEKSNQCSIIALIYNKRITKNGNVLLEVEDLTGRTVALINKDRKEVFEKSKEILLDEVVALKCSGSKEMVFVNDIIFPDIRLVEKKKSNVDECIAFTSDMHIGSEKFLEKNLLRFINWLNGEVGDEKQRQEALKVKYLFITGDSIDGVGIYPGQESQLIIKDVEGQYAKLSELLLKIREDVSIILCPGQHDAVRVAEPQPIVGENYAEALYLMKNLYLATNPCIVEVGRDVKFKVLMYHGASMHGIINSIESLRLGKGNESPTDIVKYMLKKRHLAPTHSLVTYTPLEDSDALLIEDVPDILATGDLHRPEVSDYNGVLLVASSCWQSKTDFEEKVGNNPDPCKVPIFNMKTRDVKIMDFSEVGDD